MSRTRDDILDELLVLESRNGDARALELLVRRWHPRLLRHACRLLGSEADGADAMQESWIAIVRGIARLDDPARFKTWCFRIVTRRCADFVRGRQRQRRATERVASMDAPEAPDAVQLGESRDEMVRIRAAIDQLPRERQALLALHYLEELSVPQIADVLSIPEGTVKSRLFHARTALREILEDSNDT